MGGSRYEPSEQFADHVWCTKSEEKTGKSGRRAELTSILHSSTTSKIAYGSAKNGLPIYQIGGGAGYIYNASYDENGNGMLRLTIADARAYAPTQTGPIAHNDAPTGGRSEFSQAAPSPPVKKPEAAPQGEDQGRREKARQQRLEKAISVAKQLIDDASSLVQSDPDNAKLLDFVDQIAQINKAINQEDLDAIERKSSSLSTALRHEPSYQKLEQQKLEEQKIRNAKFLGDAIKLGQRQKALMLYHITKSPSSPVASSFVKLIREVDPLLVKPSLSELQALNEKIDLTIREAGLLDAFRALPRDAPPWPRTPAQPLSREGSPDVSSWMTTKNEFLMKGDVGDTLLLYNSSSHAPHVAKNIRGDVVFSDGRADICLFEDYVDPVLSYTVTRTLAKYHLAKIIGATDLCKVDQLQSYDVIATKRDTFLRQEPEHLLALLKFVETDELKQLDVISASDLKDADDAERKKKEEIASDVANSACDGYGVILLKTGSPNICTVAPENVDGHVQILLSNGDKLAVEMSTEPFIAPRSAESAYVDVQKSQCGALYASARDLKNLSTALKRDSIAFEYSSVWVTIGEVEAADKRAQEKKAAEAREAAVRQQQLEDERKLRDQRRADEQATKSAQQKELRGKYGSSATAAAAALGEEVKAWTANRVGYIGTM